MTLLERWFSATSSTEQRQLVDWPPAWSKTEVIEKRKHPDCYTRVTLNDKLGKGNSLYSPSIDRIDNSKRYVSYDRSISTVKTHSFVCAGYITGNVWIISRRANANKIDVTCSELELLARNLKAVVRPD
jgi:hypothetical protein